MIDYYVDQAEKTKGSTPEFQSRFHIGGSFWVWLYERNRSPEAFATLIAAIPPLAALRRMCDADALERKYEIEIPLAIAMEHQALPFGLAALWAGSGAKY